MSKLGLPYLPSTLVWTKKSLDKYPLVDPTYLSKKFGHFGIKSCHFTLFSQVFNKNFFSKSLHFSENRNPQIDEGSQFRLFRHGGWLGCVGILTILLQHRSEINTTCYCYSQFYFAENITKQSHYFFLVSLFTCPSLFLCLVRFHFLSNTAPQITPDKLVLKRI